MAAFLLPSLVLLLTATELRGSAPEPGIWSFGNLTGESNYVGVVKNAFKGSRLDIRVECQTESASKPFYVSIGYTLRRTVCWEEFLALDSKEASQQQVYRSYYDSPSATPYRVGAAASEDYVQEFIKEEFTAVCNQGFVILPRENKKPEEDVTGDHGSSSSMASPVGSGEGSSIVLRTREIQRQSGPVGSDNKPMYELEKEGVYLLVVHVAAISNTRPVEARVHVEMQSPTGGFLSVTDWPLLPFYGTMCGLYLVLGLSWLIVCALHWRHILRIQFWIGGVIFLGVVENAMFLAEFQNINNSGQATEGLILAAEVVSSGKRTLARMLVIIVSLGFGIVKPRLGRVLGAGGLYFVLATIEACLRVLYPKENPSNKTLLAAVPLAVVDALICCCVFSATTTRTPRLRHLTNTLALAVVASIVFMFWSIKYHKVVDCLTEWKDLWVDEAFWHLLFYCLLCVIMVLWRPSQDNQRWSRIEVWSISGHDGILVDRAAENVQESKDDHEDFPVSGDTRY